MKLTYPILAVLLDGKEHRFDEVVSRVRHLIQPERAVRLHSSKINKQRTQCRNEERPLLQRRLPMTSPEEMSVAEATKFVIGRTLTEMSRQRDRSDTRVRVTWCDRFPEEDGNDIYILTAEGKKSVRSSQVAGKIARAIRDNLIAKGELI